MLRIHHLYLATPERTRCAVPLNRSLFLLLLSSLLRMYRIYSPFSDSLECRSNRT